MRWSLKTAISLVLALSAFAAAETLTGRVKNGTTGKPAAGDEVVLLSLAQGMEETARTKTDAKGGFSLKLDDASSPHLVRVVHQSVTYHRMAPAATTSVEVEVYDVSKRVDGIRVTADVTHLQAQNNQLQGVRLFAINNDSRPPRTQMNDPNFEFYLPDGAQVDSGLARTAFGQPITSAPVPQKEKNRYTFIFPLRPGQTQLQVTFHLPYNGQASIDPKALYATQHVVVMLPQSMQFTPESSAAAGFQSMQDPNNTTAQVQVASNTQPGQPLAFRVAGTGVLPAEGEGGTGTTGGQAGGATAGPRDSRPGGGLGPPIDAPDPLEQYRWYILGGFGAVLAAGAFYIVTRSKSMPVPDFSPSDVEVVARRPRAAAPAPGSSNVLLQALKEELFQLELEHKQGRISQQEYEKAKAALDQTLERALKRRPVRTT